MRNTRGPSLTTKYDSIHAAMRVSISDSFIRATCEGRDIPPQNLKTEDSEVSADHMEAKTFHLGPYSRHAAYPSVSSKRDFQKQGSAAPVCPSA